MKKLLMLVSLLMISNVIILEAQEGDSAGYKRNLWFYSQRYAPDDTISEYFMQSAIEERDEIRSGGYYLNPLLFTWQCIGGVTGRINTVKFADANTLIIGAPNGGVWKCSNFRSGPTWTFMDPNQNLKSNTSGALAVDNSSNIYYGTGEGIYSFVWHYLGNGIYRTTNWGDSWTHISTGIDRNIQTFRITIRPNYPDHVFAATSKGLYRSTNGGASWSVVSGTYGLHCNDIVFSQQDDAKAFITGPRGDHPDIPHGVGFRISTDGGESFVPYEGDDFQPNGRTHIAIYENNDQYVYAITDDMDLSKIQGYTSTDGGLTFSGPKDCGTSAQNGYNMLLNISRNNPAVAFVGGVKLCKTTDYGANYIQLSTTMHDDFHHMAINPTNPDEMVVVTDGGIYFSTDAGDNWTSINGQLPLMNTYRVNTGKYIFGGIQDNGFVRSSGTGFGLSFWASGDGTSIINSKSSPNIVIGITGNDGDIHYSTDGGGSYSGAISLTGKWDGGNDWIGIMVEHPEDAGHFYTARRTNPIGTINIWRSTNYGANWGEQPFGTGFSAQHAPQNLVFSTKDPDIAYLSTSGHLPNSSTFGRGLFKSTNGGVTWLSTPLIYEDDDEAEIPFHYITRVVTAPADEPSNPDEVYLTISGFYRGTNVGHVFKSTNGGANWVNISGNLPNSPVNDVVVFYPASCSASQKNIAVATDVGVFSSTNGGTNWSELAQGMPLVPVMDIEYVPFYNVIRAATFGRGVWNVSLGKMYITNLVEPQENEIYAYDDIVICSGGKLKLRNNQNISIAGGKKIIIEDGGEIELTSGSVRFSSSGTWEGVELKENGVWDVSECDMERTPTAFAITGTQGYEYTTLNLYNVTFFNCGPLQIENRANVNVTNCTFKYNYEFSGEPPVCGVVSSGSDNINIEENIIISLPSQTGVKILPSIAVYINYGSNVSVQYNTITNIRDGIMVSNSSPLVKNNTVSTTNNLNANLGIGMDYSYSSVLTGNEISSCTTAISLYSSSPVMHENSMTSTITDAKGLYANYNSSPRMKPVFSEYGVWDAGKNKIYTTGSSAKCLNINDNSIPDIDYGCNTFQPGSYFIFGTIFISFPPPGFVYNIRNNTWLPSFDPGKISLDVDYDEDPEGCDIDGPGGGGVMLAENRIDPPPYLIVNYGNGIYDTLSTFNQIALLTQDMALFLGAMKNELLGYFNTAFNTYNHIIQEYQDSSTALFSLKRLLRCKDRMNADTLAYSLLRARYQLLHANNQTDTAFSKVARELSTKCLVRMGQYSSAITEYENIISSSTDSLEILGAELNIIEIYMLMQQGGNAPSFTGKYSQLKPDNVLEGISMIREKLYGITGRNNTNFVPLRYSLSQNYPNPFNPLTKINYTIPKKTNVTLKVYDILGRLVKTLVNEFREAGYYTVQFDGSAYASGVYFYKIEAGDFVQSKKMVLVK